MGREYRAETVFGRMSGCESSALRRAFGQESGCRVTALRRDNRLGTVFGHEAGYRSEAVFGQAAGEAPLEDGLPAEPEGQRGAEGNRPPKGRAVAGSGKQELAGARASSATRVETAGLRPWLLLVVMGNAVGAISRHG